MRENFHVAFLLVNIFRRGRKKTPDMSALTKNFNNDQQSNSPEYIHGCVILKVIEN